MLSMNRSLTRPAAATKKWIYELGSSRQEAGGSGQTDGGGSVGGGGF